MRIWAVVLVSGLLMAAAESCRAAEEEERDRYLLVLQERGGLAAGTRPACFAAWRTQVVEAHYKTCPWDAPPRQRKRYARSSDIIEWRW